MQATTTNPLLARAGKKILLFKALGSGRRGPSYSDSDVCLSEIFSINLVRNCKIQEDSSLLTITSNFPLKSNYLHRQPLCAILHNGKLGESDNLLRQRIGFFRSGLHWYNQIVGTILDGFNVNL